MLARAGERAGRVDRDVVVANGIGLMSQAYEATAGLIDNGPFALAVHDADLAQATILGGAALRSADAQYPPVSARDAIVAGQVMKAGEAILVVVAAANRDPAANPDPERFEVARPGRRLYTFGAGRHACPGDTFAVTITQTAVQYLIDIGLNFDAPTAQPTYRPSANVRILVWNPWSKSMTTQQEKGRVFRALHERPQPFAIPNPWDRGTALLLEHLGFEALATTSLGVANMHGVKQVTKRQVLDNCRWICESTQLPVNADLENGFADDPREAADMVKLACECGAVGGSIEDWSGDARTGIYEFPLAVERVHAAVETARALPVPFMLTARAENFLHGRRDLDDTIKRLQAFEAAGADVLYAPGLHSLEEIRTVVSAVSKPVNVVMGFADPTLTLEQLGAVGVRRVSIGGGLSRIALSAFLDAAREMRKGRFGFITRMAPLGQLHAAFD